MVIRNPVTLSGSVELPLVGPAGLPSPALRATSPQGGEVKSLAQDLEEAPLILGGERAERRGRLRHLLGESLAHLPAGGGEHELLHASIALVGTPLDEAAGLEAVDDTGHVRGVAAEP